MSKRLADCRVAVTSRSFSKHPVLRAELLARYPQVKFNDEGVRLEGDALVAFLEGHDKAIIALEPLDAAVIARLPQLQVVSKYGVGLDNIEVAALRWHKKRLGWRGGVNRRSVSELTLGFIIALLHSVPAAEREVRGGGWRQIAGRQLSGKTVGIVGCGHVGKDLIGLLTPFQCRVLAYDIACYEEFYRTNGVEAVGLDALLAQSDVVTLHVPCDDTTRNMIGDTQLAAMKPGAVLVNAARGGIVDEEALGRALEAGHLGGVALDVLVSEPPENISILDYANVIVTPHIGGSSAEAVLAMGRAAIDGLDALEVP